MRLTTFTDYSLRTLMFVASAPEGRATIAAVARAFEISESHLVKVVHLLGKDGLLVNTRGRGGGLRLARPARSITLGRVVRATEMGDYPVKCVDGDHECAIRRVCRLRGVLEEAMGAFYDVLDRYTLEDLVARRPGIFAILHRHAPMQ